MRLNGRLAGRRRMRRRGPPVEGARFRAEVQQLGDRWARTVA
jgi:hypothetical protein